MVGWSCPGLREHIHLQAQSSHPARGHRPRGDPPGHLSPTHCSSYYSHLKFFYQRHIISLRISVCLFIFQIFRWSYCLFRLFVYLSFFSHFSIVSHRFFCVKKMFFSTHFLDIHLGSENRKIINFENIFMDIFMERVKACTFCSQRYNNINRTILS